MRNLFRKSIILLAGLGLLFFYGCQTVPDKTIEYRDVTLDNIFEEELTSNLYIDVKKNELFLNDFISKLGLENESHRVIKSSNALFLGLDSNENRKFSAVVLGEFSTFQINLGLTFSTSWKKEKIENRKVWVNPQGFQLYILDSNRIILSNYSVIPAIKTLEYGIITQPKDPIVFKLKNIDDKVIRSMTMGFISGGVESMVAKAYPYKQGYVINTQLGFLSASKANGFRLLLNIFLRVLRASNIEPEYGKAIENLEIYSEEDSVYLENLEFSSTNIMNILNNLIFKEGETDT